MQRGYLGLTARSGFRNPPSYVGPVKLGCILPAYIPQNCNTPKYGWTDDHCIHGMYTSNKNNKLFQVRTLFLLFSLKHFSMTHFCCGFT